MKPAETSGYKEIFVLDDDRGSREALRIILQTAGYHVTCFADETSLLEAIRQRSPVSIFLDLMLPNRSGLEILNDDLADYAAPVLMISGHGDIPAAVKAIKAGALDFISKPFSGPDIVRRLEDALRLFSHRNSDLPRQRLSALNFPGRETLSDREREVLDHVAAGSSSKEAASALGVSPRTVEDHRANLLRKLGARTSTELMFRILRWNSETTKP